MYRVFLSALLLTACAAETPSIPGHDQEPTQTTPSGVAYAAAQDAPQTPPTADASADSPPPPVDASTPVQDAAPPNPGTEPTIAACESTISRERLCAKTNGPYHWGVLVECTGTPYRTDPQYVARWRDAKTGCDRINVGGGYMLLCCM